VLTGNVGVRGSPSALAIKTRDNNRSALLQMAKENATQLSRVSTRQGGDEQRVRPSTTLMTIKPSVPSKRKHFALACELNS
jgi:hypothetical protein